MTASLCLVIGAGPGLGLAVARCFAREGHALALVARSPDKLQTAVDELRRQGTRTAACPTAEADLAATLTAIEAGAQRGAGVCPARGANAEH